MKNTKIEWCDMTWNPVTGCLNKCEYCYARRIAERFSAQDKAKTFYDGNPYIFKHGYCLHELDYPAITNVDRIEPYPFGFEPTFHRYRLSEPQKVKKTKTIFVCSMADLFGKWVPDSWIREVFEACEKAPQHRYLFLTKNPDRYIDVPIPPDNMWFGYTKTKNNAVDIGSNCMHIFVSYEPLLERISRPEIRADWVIIGAETGNRKGKVKPEKEWIDEICKAAKDKPVFMKDSLIPIVGEKNMRREFPW